MKKKKRITSKVGRILEQIKGRSKDQNSEEIQKVEDTKNQTIGGEFNESKYQIFEEVTNSKSSILVSKL